MLLEAAFMSETLKKQTLVNVIVPDKVPEDAPPRRTLWLLHGLAGNHASWARSSFIERYAQEHNLTVVMPDAGRSWYTNTVYGERYFDYITEELPARCRSTFCGITERREDNIVGGLSMGGYGALKIALSFPERYGACISLSGSLDITRKNRPVDLALWRSLFNYDMNSPDELENTPHDLFFLAEKCVREGSVLPEIFMWCGTEDSLLQINAKFDEHLTRLGIAHTYRFSEGNHSWRWWDMHIKNGLDELMKKI